VDFFHTHDLLLRIPIIKTLNFTGLFSFHYKSTPARHFLHDHIHKSQLVALKSHLKVKLFATMFINNNNNNNNNNDRLTAFDPGQPG